MTAALYDSIIDITEVYLGPAARRFISRQVSFHLNKKPEEVDRGDLPQLVEWIKTALSLLTEDQVLLQEFERRIRNLELSLSD